jgi:hypothetical protein
MTRLWWVSADGQRSIDMGELPAAGTRGQWESSAWADLLEHCATDEERRQIRAGLLEWEEVSCDA